MRVNELLNWQVAAADTVDIADASVTKVYSSVRLQQLGQLLEEVVARHGDPAEEETAQLRHWLDIQAKRNTVLTFRRRSQRNPARADRDGGARPAPGAQVNVRT